MRRNKAILFIDQYKSRRKHFLKQEDCDIYILLDNKMIGLHKQYMTDSRFLVRQVEEEGRKLCLMDQNVNSFVLYKTIGCLYGLQYCFERAWEAISIYEILVLLEVDMLKRLMEKDFKNNFDQYGFFVLFSASIRFNLQWLMQICKEQLLMFGFQQLNFNKSDFLLCQIGTVEHLVSLYCRFHKTPKTMRKQKFKSAISHYCKQRGVKIQLNYYLQQYVDTTINQVEQEDECSSYSTIKRNKISLQTSNNNMRSDISTINSFQIQVKDKQMNKQTRVKIVKNKLFASNALNEIVNIDDYSLQGNQTPNTNNLSAGSYDDDNDDDIKQFNQQQFTFTQLCGFTDSKFIQSQSNHRNNERKQGRKQSRKKHRSNSPPASPWTPQFGEYLKRSHQKKEEKKRVINPKKLYRRA